MECSKCNDTGRTMIDVGAPGGNGCVAGYCECGYGIDLSRKEICYICNCHKDETPEKSLYPYVHDSFACKTCLSSNSEKSF